MNLKNGYKVIYEDRAIASDVLTRHLKATKTIRATGDANVTYKDGNGAVISTETLKTFKLVYENDGCLFGSTNGKVNKNASGTITDTKILVYSGNDLVLGVAPVVAQVSNPTVTKKSTKVEAKEEIKEEAKEEE